MKKTLIACTFALALTACGGGSKEAKLTQLCIDDGSSSKAECECMAKAAVDKLDGALIDKLIKASSNSGGSDAAMSEMMSDLTPEQMGQFMAFGMEIGTSCSQN